MMTTSDDDETVFDQTPPSKLFFGSEEDALFTQQSDGQAQFSDAEEAEAGQKRSSTSSKTTASPDAVMTEANSKGRDNNNDGAMDDSVTVTARNTTASTLRNPYNKQVRAQERKVVKPTDYGLPARKTMRRVAVRMHVESQDNVYDAQDEFKKCFVELFKTVTDISPGAILYPWKAAKFSTVPALTKSSQIDKPEFTAKTIRETYANRAFTKEGMSEVYFDIYLGLRTEYETFYEKAGSTLRTKGITFFYETLQAEGSFQFGYLLFSYKWMDTKKLEEDIYAVTGVEVMARNRRVIGTPEQNNDEKDVVEAIHLECDSAYKHGDRNRVYDQFSSDPDKPSTIQAAVPMKMIVPYRRMSKETKIKGNGFRAAQKKFSETVLSSKVFNVFTKNINLEISKGDGVTLRDLLLDATVPHSAENLLIAADQAPSDAFPTVTYLPKDEEHVLHFLRGICTTLKQLTPNERVFKLESFFTSDALDTAQTQTWSNVLQKHIEQEETWMEEHFAALQIEDGGGIIENMEEVIEDSRQVRTQATWRDRYNPNDESLPSSVGRSLSTWKTAASDITEDQYQNIEMETYDENSNNPNQASNQEVEHLGTNVANNNSAGSVDPVTNSLLEGTHNSREQGLGMPNSDNNETEADATAGGVGSTP